jgi:type 1 glutamine amidotransferase
MKKIIYIISALTLLVSTVLIFPGCQTEQKVNAPYTALLVTGQNNHNWQVSSEVLKQILENSSLFSVDMAVSPASGEEMSAFKPVFADYDIVVLDYNGDSWPEETKTSFVDYVSQGGGVVVYHAADNAFPDWPEYNEIIGLGGWGDRDENSGPYVRWKDGEFTRDMSPGRGGSHGAQHAFRVTNRDTEHPVTRGLPENWMHEKDELYSQLRGPAKNMTVLATAYADTAQGGTGENEPMLMAISYGQGRVFHTVIGHAGKDEVTNPAMQCVGFIVTLQRGAEWAATGDVTQEVPIDFPSFNVLSSWEKYRPMTFDELLDCLEDYHKGDNRHCVQDLTNTLRQASGEQGKMEEYEKELIRFIGSSATSDAINEVCRELSLWGSENCIPALEKLMENDDTREMARFAIERINGEYSN